MKRSMPMFLIVSAALVGGSALASLPEKKQQNPGKACSSGASSTGMAITEEGGLNQHADKPRPKGQTVSPAGGPGKASASQNGQTLRHAINSKGTGATGRSSEACPQS